MIVTEAELRVALGYGDELPAAEHAALQQAHIQAEEAVRQYIQYDPEQRTYTEFYPTRTHAGGMGLPNDGYWAANATHAYYRSRNTVTDNLQLRHLPLRKIHSVYVNRDGRFTANIDEQFDDTFDPEFTGVQSQSEKWVEGQHYWGEFQQEQYCPSSILLSSTGWPLEPGSVRVRYTAGYSAAEFSGVVDDASAARDAEVGIISTPGVSAAGISRAVVLTVTSAMHTWQAYKRVNTDGAAKGFSGGTTYQSERLQDYSYTRPSAASTDQLVGLMAALPREAMMLLRDYRHYGVLRV